MSRTGVSRPTSDVFAGRLPRSDGLLALAGAGIFAAITVLLHFVKDDFAPCCRFMSEYVLGDWGWLQNVAFVALGGAFLALAHGLRGGLSSGRRVTASVRLMYVVGITTIIGGLFNSDSIMEEEAGHTSWHGMLHDLFGFVAFGCAYVATFFLRGVFARDPQWRRYAPHALMFAISMMATFALMLIAPTDSFGIAQRVFVTVDLLWVGTLGCALLGVVPALPNPHESWSAPK